MVAKIATTAKAKWEKYFAASDVSTHIKSRSGKPIYAYDLTGKRLPLEFSDGDTITVLRADQYNPQYIIRTDAGSLCTVSELFVAKPTGISSPESMRLSATSLCREGVLDIRSFAGHDFSFYTFNSFNNLANSVISGLKSNWRVPERIVNQFQDYCEQQSKTSFQWHKDITHEEKNQLGKYIGAEIIPGLLLLDGQLDYRGMDSKTFGSYGIPADCSFSGIDSIHYGHHFQTLISAKYGPGARSSVFSNIVSDGISRGYRDSVFADLCDSAKTAGVSRETLVAKSGSRETLYSYGITHILSERKTDPTQIFRDIRRHVIEGTCLSDDSRNVLNRISELAEPKIKEKLPGSATQFFSRETARRLNADTKSLEQMKEVLAEKNYLQLNLHIPSWLRGEICYGQTRSSETNIKITGNKSIIGDIDARHGTLSYEFVK